MVFAAVVGNEQAEKSFKRSPDPCTAPIDMRTTFHGQLNFTHPSSSSPPHQPAKKFLGIHYWYPNLLEHAGMTDTSLLSASRGSSLRGGSLRPSLEP